jgi:hypothetical protein
MANLSHQSGLFSVDQCIEENIPFSGGYRDFEGYKGKYPDPKWPGGAKIAVNVVLNYEEGGEYRYLFKEYNIQVFMQHADSS